jgi:hypothetical protein
MEIDLNQPSEKIAKPKKTPKPPKIKRAKSTSSAGHYVTNAVLFPEVVKCQETGIISKELAKMFTQIATRYLSAKNFANLSYIRDDLISHAVYTLCANGLKFNPEKGSNCFSYYTTVIYHATLQYIASEKKQRDIRDQILCDSGANASLGFMEKAKDEYREEHYDSFRMKD